MRKTKSLVLISCLLFIGINKMSSQENQDTMILKKDFKIQKHTLMERFEPGYVASPKERADLKNKRIANAEYTLRVLDTIKISDRRKKLLLRDLKYNPFSERLNKFIVDTKFEDDEGND